MLEREQQTNEPTCWVCGKNVYREGGVHRKCKATIKYRTSQKEPWLVEQILALLTREPYMSQSDVAGQIGRSPQRVQQLKVEFNLPFKKRPPDYLCWVCNDDVHRAGGLHHRCTRNPMAVAARFWARVDRTDECWEWQGAKLPYGYGRFQMPSATGGHYQDSAHRVAWVLAKGPIPNGLFVLHHCDNPPCVNPQHLFLGTQADNVHDRDVKGRHRTGIGALGYRKKVCKRGHDRTDPDNLYIYTYANGKIQRTCKACARDPCASDHPESRHRKKAAFQPPSSWYCDQPKTLM